MAEKPLQPPSIIVVSEEQRKRAAYLQSSVIVRPIVDYLRMYALEKVITFIYYGRFKDVDVLDPILDSSSVLDEKRKDIERIISLMDKHGIPVSHEIQLHQRDLQKKNDLKNTIRNFENWLVGHLIYLNLEGLTIESIYYSPRTGFLVKFEGLEMLKDETSELPINYYHLVPQNKELAKKSVFNKIAGFSKIKRKIEYSSRESWMESSVGYKWVREQLKYGRPRKEIIQEFNRRHQKDPDNYSTRGGKELSAAILSHWAKGR